MRCCLILSGVIFGLAAFYWKNLDLSVPEEFYYKTDDFIRKFEYSYETHEIVTEDGFTVTLFRMLACGQSHNRKVPVLLEAGLFGSSDVLVMRGPQKDLPYILADNGYDVWLGNYRGNRYSVPGPTTNITDAKTHNFGFEEIGVYDFASTIDFVLKQTGQRQLDIIVVSAGSSSLLALQCLRPEYNDKIRKALHFGSGMALRLDNPYQALWFYLCWKLPWLVEFLKILEPLPHIKPQAMLIFCERTFLAPVCRNLLVQSIGYPEDQDNTTLSAMLFTLLPSGNPLGVVDHVMQLSNAKDFTMRDWGPAENQRRYNQSKPPLYDVTGITTYTKSYVTKDEGLVIYDIPRKVFGRMKNFVGEFAIDSPFAHVNFFINSGRNQLFIADILLTLSD